ncbi:uncharacterized protein LOC135500158 [Lineus longissimus]|uniref:uncharacterized protein LOC135500158 n=1 Tax=Lineus longissimus TaxID=88925 RepID=UPI00315C6A63
MASSDTEPSGSQEPLTGPSGTVSEKQGLWLRQGCSLIGRDMLKLLMQLQVIGDGADLKARPKSMASFTEKHWLQSFSVEEFGNRFKALTGSEISVVVGMAHLDDCLWSRRLVCHVAIRYANGSQKVTAPVVTAAAKAKGAAPAVVEKTATKRAAADGDDEAGSRLDSLEAELKKLKQAKGATSGETALAQFAGEKPVGDDKDDVCEAVLIVDFDILPSAPGPFLKGKPSDAKPIFGLPNADLEDGCNCMVEGKTVAVKQATVMVDSSGSDMSDIEDDLSELVVSDTGSLSDKDEQEEEFRSITFMIKGSTFTKERQEALKFHRGKEVETKIENEVDNPVDKNALGIKIQIQGEFRLIGYVPKDRISAVSNAIEKAEIHSIKITKIICRYVPAANDCVFIGYCEIVKKGPWPSSDTSYSYGDKLNLAMSTDD